jgi:hypothetical protein
VTAPALPDTSVLNLGQCQFFKPMSKVSQRLVPCLRDLQTEGHTFAID